MVTVVVDVVVTLVKTNKKIKCGLKTMTYVNGRATLTFPPEPLETGGAVLKSNMKSLLSNFILLNNDDDDCP